MSHALWRLMLDSVAWLDLVHDVIPDMVVKSQIAFSLLNKLKNKLAF